MIVCKNCTYEYEANYCPSCGQKASVRRFSTRILFADLLDKVLPLDRGVIFTTQRLFTQPGAMLREYLGGKRVAYTKPLQFLLVAVAISLVFFSSDEFKQQVQSGYGQMNTGRSAEAAAFQQEIATLFSTNMTLVVVAMIPILAWIARWLYKKHDLNYAEHFVMNCYLLAGCMIMGMPFMLGLKLAGKSAYSPDVAGYFTIFYIGYFVWGHISFFREPNRIWNGVKGMLTFLLAYLLYILLVGIVAFVVTMLYFKFIKN